MTNEKKLFKELNKFQFSKALRTDLILFLMDQKNGVRTSTNSFEEARQLSDYFTSKHFEAYYDSENYVFIAKSKNILKNLIHFDQGTSPFEFGKLLGYPTCCCKKIEELGESEIDNFENSYNSSHFKGKFIYINPKPYNAGTALISHVPCHSKCKASLDIALTTISYIKTNKELSFFKPWIDFWKF